MQNVGYNCVVPAAWHEFLKCYMSNVVRLLISIHHTVFLNAPMVHYYYLLICVPLAFIYARHRSLRSTFLLLLRNAPSESWSRG